MSLALLLLACTPDEKAPAAKAQACDMDELPLATDYRPTAPIEVRIDDRAIPHLYAQNDLDLFYAQGYQLATDRLFLLDQWRRAARGTLAEVKGEGDVVGDLTARTFKLHLYECESLKRVHDERPDDLQLLLAYTSGINRRVAQISAGEIELPWGFRPTELDYAPEPFVPGDIVVVGRRITLGYSETFSYDLLYGLFQRLVPNYDDFPVFHPGPERFITTDVPPAGSSEARRAPRGGAIDLAVATQALAAANRLHRTFDLGGSNNWAINPAHTDSGRPLLANDPHSGWYDPSVLSLMHLNSADAGGAFDVVGFSFPGVPGIQLGHNDRLAWAATTAQADQSDIWAVEISGDDAMLGGERVPIQLTEEIIRVRMADGTFEERPYTVRSVDGYGVLLPDELLPIPATIFEADALLVNWVGLSGTNEILQYLDLDRAEDLDSFEAAINYQRVGMHNWLGATVDGIRYHTHGLIPDRGPVGARAAANSVLDGDDAATFWTGDHVDGEALPHLDGTQDFIATANNDPFGSTADNDPLNDEIYYGSFFSPGYRAERIHGELTRLVAAGPVTAAQMQTLQMDDYSLLAAELIPLLEAAAGTIETDESLASFRGRADLVAAVARLSAWDRRAGRGSPEAALFRAWQGFATRKSLSSDLSILFAALDQAAPVSLAKITSLVYARDTESVLHGRGSYYLIASLDEALTWTGARAAEEGAAAFTWTEMHRGQFTPLLGDNLLIPVAGDESTVNVAECTFWDGDEPRDHCDAGGGAVFRSVTGFDADGTPVTEFTAPFGPDGDVTMWSEGIYDALAYRRADVEARTVETKLIE